MKALTKVARWLREVFIGPLSPEERQREWVDVHQPFELRFHQRQNYRWDEDIFQAQWNEVFGTLMGLDRSTWGPRHVLADVGCGSRPCLDWFTTPCAKCFIDPLLSQYIEIPQMSGYWKEKPREHLFSTPAERMLDELEGRCDFVNCWNVLDHTYDWRQILDNIRRYAKPGGLVCIGTDFESHGEGHPGIESSAEFFAILREHFEIEEERRHFERREVALRLRKK